MAKIGREELKLAVSAVISSASPYVLRHVKSASEIDAPLVFDGDWAQFNPLLELARDDVHTTALPSSWRK